MEQCRSVNPFISTGVFNPLKLTDRSIIIESLVLLHVTAMIFILLQKLLYHIRKQCIQLSDIFSFIICLVSTLVLHCLSNSFIWVLGFIGLTDCVQIMIKCIFCSLLKVYASVNNLSDIHVLGRFMNFWMEPVLSRTYKVSS